MSEFLENLYQKYINSSGVSTDTRKITKDCIFFALKGANFNGNAFALEALEKGATYVVVDEIIEPAQADNERLILVEDVLNTLQALANYHRQTFAIPIIAVGGSNGKTTTKELIRNVLAKSYETFATPGNLNNHIGVPLSLLAMPKNTEIAIIEMGANHEGEIALLCDIAQPTYGIITNIGKDHLEGFGSLEGVARANSELFLYLLKNKGKVFVNTSEELVYRMASRFEDPVTYPNPGDYFQAKLLEDDFLVSLETENDEIMNTQLFGQYNFYNICTALCIGKFFEVPSYLANQAVGEYQPQNNRSQLIQKNGNTILLDAYNANPSSMQVAIENFAKIKAASKIVILGDMFELGEQSHAEHQKLGEQVAAAQFDTVVFFGEATQAALIANPKAYFFTDKFSLHNWIQDRAIQNSHILIKGSRGVSLETVLQFI